MTETKKTQDIPIVYSTNDFYLPYVSVSIQSIIQHADRLRKYCFYILYQELNEKNIELVNKQIESYHNCTVQFINVGSYLKTANLFTSRHITVETYFRLFIPFLFEHYDKVIYLDGDITCITDIAELFDIEIDNYMIAAVRDISVAWYYKPLKTAASKKLYHVMLSLPKPEEYFGAGVLVINTKLFRNNYTSQELIDLASSREWQVHDQDILNHICFGKVLLLSYRWNMMYTENSGYLPDILKNDYTASEKNPKLIHFKPWTASYFASYSNYFWKYAAKTFFFELIITRMEESGLFDLSIQDRIYNDIKNGRAFGLRFICTAFIIWLKNKLRK
jgi:lipopolysaccharide biosynthesis glycosyltransferase